MENWITSDTHKGHKNIVKGVSSWTDLSKCRDFETVEQHDLHIIDNINKYVKEDDTLWHLGDWSFGGIENVFAFRDKIKCRNIHIILGNHDHHIARNKKWFDRYSRELFSSVSDLVHRSFSGEDVVLCHYAMRTWENAHHGAIMLHGHSHDTLSDYSAVKGFPTKESEKYKTMDIGVDPAFRITGEYRPFHIDEIMEIMKHRIPLGVDHHNEKTN